jgi:hypothetical protein
MFITTTYVKVDSDVLERYVAFIFGVTGLDCSGYCSDWEKELG